MAIANQRLKLALFAIVFVVISLYFISGRPELKNIAKVPESLPKPWNPLKPKLIEDAHSLANADDFLPHFKAVTALRGISFAEGKAGCNWENEGAVNFMYGNEADWVTQDRNDTEIGLKRKQWHDFIDNDLVPYSMHKDRFYGRGIAIVAGNEETIKRVKVIIRQLLRLNCHLRIEIHYWNDEISQASKESLQAMWPKMIYFIDLSSQFNVAQTRSNYYTINWQFKTAAVLNSRFEEVLLLDSDNIPTLNPESLFESELYQKYGTIFWPDIARTRPNNPIWAITNNVCRMDEYEQESGQMIVDKRKFFYHLQLSHWMNNNQGAYYNQFLLGDKDMFRFSWKALQTAYGTPAKWLTSVGTLNDGFYCGHTFAQHHPNGSIAFLHGGLLKGLPWEVVRTQRDKNGGVFQVYKSSKDEEDPSAVVHVEIRWNDGSRFDHALLGDKTGWACTEMYDELPKPLDEVVPGFEQTFRETGGYWMLDDAK